MINERKKAIAYQLAIIMALLASLSASVNAQSLTNPDFEAGTQGWSNWGRFSITSDAYTGSSAARATATGGFGTSSYTDVTPGETYTLSAYAKTSGTPSFAGVGMHFLDAGNSQVGQDAVRVSSASYSLVTKDITIPTNAARVRIWGWVDGSGSLTVDDISLQLVVPEPPPPTEPPTEPPSEPPTEPPGGTGNYFVDARRGNDASSGLEGQPWRTLSRANEQNLNPGDVVHLTSGQTFSGTLELTSVDKGSSGAPVRVQSTGEQPAIINGGSGSGLILDRVSDVEVENLVLIGAGRKTGNTADGLLISDSNRVSVSHIDVSGFQHSGIFAYNSSDVRLTYIHAHNNGFAGIHGYSEGAGIGNRSRNIYIGYSRAINNPGDPTVTDNHSGNGIVVGNVDNVTIEYSFAEENGWDMPRVGNGPVGIWIWQSDNSLLQYNIARRNKTPSGALDGGGFDFDGGVTNSIMQYNISYENDGAGYGLYQFAGATPWYNNIIRYNISENDGVRNSGGIGVWTASSNETMRDAYIYNNVVYNTNGPALVYANNLHDNFNYSNNIFVYRGSGISGTYGPAQNNLIGNLWHDIGGGFNVAGYGSLQALADGIKEELYNGAVAGVTGSPQFADAGASQITDPTLIPEYLKYRLNSNSPAINAGIDVNALYGQGLPSADLYGNNAIFGPAVDMGVHEFPGTPDGPNEPEAPDNDCSANPGAANLLFNQGFESQTSGFYVWNNGRVVTSNVFEGSYAFRAIGANTGAAQIVRNLAPNTTYRFSGWGTSTETTSNNQLMLGAKNYSTTNGSDQVIVNFTGPTYACKFLTFTTGSSNTSAELFVYQWQGAGTGYADALKLNIEAEQALKILALGDSITQSDASNPGYRYYLWRHLINNDYSFDLIGSGRGPYLYSGETAPQYPDYQGRKFDQDNEGHAGWTTRNVVEGHPDWGFPDGLQQWVGSYTADTVLLHIGTNDVWYHSWPPNAEQSASTALGYVENIIDILQADNPDVTIFLAQIIPYASWYASEGYDFKSFIGSFNAGIPAIASRKSTARSDIIVVDHFTGFDDSLIRSDGIHPNQEGQRRMAQRWIDAMNAYYK